MTRLPPCLAAALWLAAHALSAQSTDLKLELEKERALEDFRWGVRAFHETHWSDAVLSFEKSLSRRPQDPRTRVWLGNALYKNGFEEEALNEWRQALALDPGNATLRNRIQLTSFRRGVAGELARGSRYVVAAELKAGKGKDAPLRRPTTVHPRPDGSAYVVAFGSNRIVLLDANNGVREVLSGGLKGYLRPFDCLEVTDPRSGERALYISEYGADRLLKADLRGERLKEFGGLRGPQYLAADPSGYLYVTEWGSSRVSKFDLDGNLILSFRQPPAAPTGIAARETWTDSHFDVLARPVAVPDSTGWVEEAFGTQPLRSWVDLTDGRDGLAILPKGLFEYEALEDRDRTLLLTLIRACRIKLVVSNEKQTLLSDTGIQCPGSRTFEYAILAHEGDWRAAHLPRVALEYAAPPRAAAAGRGRGSLPPEASLLMIDNPDVPVSCVKGAEDGKGLIVRLYNPTAAEQRFEVAFGCRIASAARCRMDESAIESCAVTDGTLRATIGPKKILTFRIATG